MAKYVIYKKNTSRSITSSENSLAVKKEKEKKKKQIEYWTGSD